MKIKSNTGLHFTPALAKALKGLKRNFKKRAKPPRVYKWYGQSL